MKRIFTVSAFLLLLSAVSFCSCEKAKVAKATDCYITGLKILEYPDAPVVFDGVNIGIKLPIDVTDLNLTPVYGISEKATSTPASGEKQNFGIGVVFTVTAEDSTYALSYYASVSYPHTVDDFSSLPLSATADETKINTPFAMEYTSFSAGDAAASPWGGFALSNMEYDPSASYTDGQMELMSANRVNGVSKNYMLVKALNCSAERADTATITFSRHANLDTIRISPSVILNKIIKEGHGAEPAFAGGDYLNLVFEAYDKYNKHLGSRIFTVADYRAGAQYNYFKDKWEVMDFIVSKFKRVKKVKIYSQSSRPNLDPVFAIDYMSYKVQPEYVSND